MNNRFWRKKKKREKKVLRYKRRERERKNVLNLEFNRLFINNYILKFESKSRVKIKII